MAFDTRYDVSTQVDSSEPADKPPAMCGNATLAIDVSRTSMKVASVTVTAITQGLIEPSGIRNFDRSLCRIAFRYLLPSLCNSRTNTGSSSTRLLPSHPRSSQAAIPLSAPESDQR